MSLGVFNATVVNETGDIQPGAAVEVRRESDNSLAVIYDTDAGTTPASNPGVVDENAFFQFYAAPDRYTVAATGTGSTVTWVVDLTGTQIEDVAALKASDYHMAVGDIVITLTEGYRYQVVASGGHITTTGGVQLKHLRDATGIAHALAIYDGVDMGVAVNTLFAEYGENTGVLIGANEPGEKWPLLTPIDLNVASHLTLMGMRGSFIATTLEMPAGSSMIGVNAQFQDESAVVDLRIIEGSGSVTCANIIMGGTSGRISGCWLANTKYVAIIGGAEVAMCDVIVEHGYAGFVVSSGFCDYDIGMTTPITSVSDPNFLRCYLYSCGQNNGNRAAAVLTTKFIRATVSGVSGGTFSQGDTITSTAGGAGVVWSSNQTDSIIIDQWSNNLDGFQPGDTLTGSSGATATLDGVNVNLVRNARFDACRVLDSHRHGLIVEYADSFTFKGTIRSSGHKATSASYGVHADYGATVSLYANILDSNPEGDGASGIGYGLLATNDARVNAHGGTWGASQFTQDYGARAQTGGSINLFGVDLEGNTVAPVFASNALSTYGCFGVDDSNLTATKIAVDDLIITGAINMRDTSADKAAGYGPVRANNVTVDLSGPIEIDLLETHIWDVWQQATNGATQTIRSLYVSRQSSGAITATDVSAFDIGSSTALVVDNLDGTYTVQVTNNNANDRDYYGRLGTKLRNSI